MKLLDADVCIAFLNGRDKKLERRLIDDAEELVLCSVVKAELLYGAACSQRPEENRRKLAVFFDTLDSLPFDDECAEVYGNVRATLRRNGTPIGPNDLLIAATALGHGVGVVTRNRREFERVEGLQVETW